MKTIHVQDLAINMILLVVSFSSARNNGPVTITLNGQQYTKYVLSSNMSKQFIQVNGSSITFLGGGRAYLGDSNSNNLLPHSFYQLSLLGKRLSFDVDIAEVGCSCNGALYFVSMPGYNAAEQPDPGEQQDYYCDANMVGGTFCPEMDVMEANKFAMASLAHTCQNPAPHYYSSCDRRGCGTNVLNVDKSAFGPGKRIIDTNKLFTLSVSFMTQNDKLTAVDNQLSQGNQSIVFIVCNPDYLKSMGDDLSRIVMSMSLRGTDSGGMSWLDGKSGCQGACDIANSRVTFSNIRLTDL